MEIKAAFLKRRSIRKFITKAVSDKDIQEILLAASLAPSARNVQPWEFIIIKDENVKNEIARLASQNGPFIADAPVCIAVFCQDTKYYLEDGCAATTQALLCAASLGLAACWVAGDKKDYSEAVKKLLGVPAGYRFVSLFALGYSDEKPTVNKRNIKDMVHQERF